MIKPLATWRNTDRNDHLIGDIIYVSTTNSRRMARIVGIRPGWILLSYLVEERTWKSSDLPLFHHAAKTKKKIRSKWTPEKQAAYMDRYYNDPQFRIAQLLRKRVVKLVKKENKSARTLDMLGCTLTEFMTYMESKFTDGMTWKSFGKWQIDHIRPCASYDLTQHNQQRDCFHHSNLQPLWAIDNRIKSDKWIGYVRRRKVAV